MSASDAELVLAILTVVVATCFIMGQVIELRANRRPRRPMSSDSCRVCDRQLRHGDIWEQREHMAADAGMPDFGGGTFLAITYCRRHRPRGAVRT